MRLLAGAISVATLGLVLAAAPARAQTFDSGSTGADGPFTPTASVTLTLPPSGVFNFTTVSIPSGVTVRFTRNAANTPVAILATGNVTVGGTLDVGGAPGGNGVAATLLANNGGAGGPGGFAGGTGGNGIVSTSGGRGLGPGGGSQGTSAGGVGGGGFGTAGGAGGANNASGGPAYGTATLLPLVGGSGGAGALNGPGTTAAGGGGGGGALLIASSGTITFTGAILAQGGGGGNNDGGGGSGGGVRLVATTIAGSGGSINVSGGARSVNGGAGGAGRVRIEAYTNTLTANFSGALPSVSQPSVAILPPAAAPALRITSVAGVAPPAAPGGSFATPDVTLPATTTNPVAVSLAGTNIPPGTSVTVLVQGQADAVTTATTTLTGTQASTTASLSLTIPTNQPSVITASASFTLLASSGGPVLVQGEEVERMRVSAALGGASRVAYVTRSGREVVVTPGR